MPELPKLSELLKLAAKPEQDLASVLESVTGIAPPPGPMTFLTQMAEAFEESVQLPELPSLSSLVPEVKFTKEKEEVKQPKVEKKAPRAREVYLP